MICSVYTVTVCVIYMKHFYLNHQPHQSYTRLHGLQVLVKGQGLSRVGLCGRVWPAELSNPAHDWIP